MSAFRENGVYLLHRDAHCVGLRIDAEVAHVYDSNLSRSRIYNCNDLEKLVSSSEGYIVFKIDTSPITPNVSDSSMDIAAAAEYEFPIPEPPIWQIEKYQPLREEGRAEAALAARLKSEISFIQKELGKRRPSIACAEKMKCPLCPYRVFRKKYRDVEHIRIYHSEKEGFSPTSAMYRLAQDLHNGDLIRSVIVESQLRCDVMQRAAKLMRSWLGDPPSGTDSELDVTSDISRFITVVFSGDDGPKYCLKSRTYGYFRLNEKTYFDYKFANMMLMTALNSQGRLETMRGQLTAYYCIKGAGIVGLLHRHTDFYQDCLIYLMQRKEVKDLTGRNIKV